MSTIKVDTIATRTGSGNITASNTIAGTSATLSGTLAVTGATTTAAITSTGRHDVNFDGSSTQAFKYTDTGGGNLAAFGQFYNPSNALIGNIQNANNAGIHLNVGNGSVVFTQTGYTAANALDDYEEGTWTVVNRSIASITITNNSTAQYRKVGSLVFISFYITYPTTSDSNNAKINLPFAAAASVGYSYCTGRFSGSAKSSSTGFLMQMNQGSDETVFYPHTAPQTAYINSEFSGKYLLMSGCYIAA